MFNPDCFGSRQQEEELSCLLAGTRWTDEDSVVARIVGITIDSNVVRVAFNPSFVGCNLVDHIPSWDTIIIIYRSIRKKCVKITVDKIAVSSFSYTLVNLEGEHKAYLKR